jgi:hypothetical protein
VKDVVCLDDMALVERGALTAIAKALTLLG